MATWRLITYTPRSQRSNAHRGGDVVFRIKPTDRGFSVTENERVVAGPFQSYGEAADWIVQHGSEIDREERDEHVRALGKARAELLPAIHKEIKDAIATPSAALHQGRGHPVADNSHESLLAYEYYWRVRRRSASPTRVIAKVAKKYDCTPDHVRKIRTEYAPIEHYDDDLLTQLRAQALKWRKHPPVRVVPAAELSQLERAELWLRGLLTSGSFQADEVKRLAGQAGLKGRTLERAKASIGIKSVRAGRLSTWWSLPP
jgi:hypothetical protein